MFKNGAYYNSIGPYLKDLFGRRVAKVSIDGGFTCPNRDGKISSGGCYFCSSKGSGDFSSGRNLSITEQIDSQIAVLQNKWPDSIYLAYFQNFTNTYAGLDELRVKFEEAVSHKSCIGIAIATRPDCLPDDILDYLQELSTRTFLWVELGLQTINDNSAERFNRGYHLSVYDNAVDELIKRDIRVVTHLIFGLPGETHQDMLNSIIYICKKNIFGIKIQLLTFLQGTVFGDGYLHNMYHALEKDEYISLTADALELIPPAITIHRLTGDAPRNILLAPKWSLDKKSVLNGINKEMKRRGHIQGEFSH